MKHILLTGLCALALTACTQSGHTAANTAPDFDTDAMDAVLSAAVEQGQAGGIAALIFDEGHVVYQEEFGFANIERGQPITEDTVFRIYSMTKPVTSVIIMDLIEEGKLSLSDPASKFIPALAAMQVASLGPDGTPMMSPQADPMTIEDLLLHRAGLGYGIFGPINGVEDMYMKAGLFDPMASMEEVVGKLTQLPLLQQPGQAWYYSLSIDVLGRIAEVVEGKSLGEIMRERIFDPLGMSETGFTVRPDQVARFASNYAATPDGLVLEDDGLSSPFANPQARYQSGGGGLVSTMGDYAKFAQMMLDGGIYKGHRVLDAATVKLMMTPHMDGDDTFLFPWLGGETLTGFGYGGAVVYGEPEANRTLKGQDIGQWGWSGAARTNFYIDPKNNAFGIIMMQVFVADDPAVHDSYQALAYVQTRNDKPAE